MSQSPAHKPVSLNADRTAGRLTIEWADGHHTEYDAVALRLLCPCAFCQGEAGRPGWLDTNPTLNSNQTQLVGAHLVGAYALAPTWADGHDTGYYTFESLRENCPCEQCTAIRLARTES